MNQISIVTNFCMHLVYTLDRGMLARRKVIDVFKEKDKRVMQMLKEKYKLATDDDVNRLVADALKYICEIRFDINQRLRAYSEENLKAILNSQDEAMKFLKKYMKNEEDFKNDKFLQCD